MSVLQFLFDNWQKISMVGYVCLEWWLGRTQKTQANSVVDLVMLVLKTVMAKRDGTSQN